MPKADSHHYINSLSFVNIGGVDGTPQVNVHELPRVLQSLSPPLAENPLKTLDHKKGFYWWSRWDSNPHSPLCHSGALAS